MRDINEIHMYSRNNKKHPEKQISLLVANIKEFGFTNPILIDKTDNIIAGHARYLAAKRLNIPELPCIELSDLTATQVKALRISDNRLAELAETDIEMLKLEIGDLKLENFNIELLGCDDLNLGQDIKEDDYETPEEIETKIKIGDIFELGDHRLMCGDATKKEDVRSLMVDKKADMIFTDPPYNAAFNGRSGDFNVIKNDKLKEDDFDKFIKQFIDTYKLFRAPHEYFCCNWKLYPKLYSLIGANNLIIWDKKSFGMGNG